MPVKGSCRAILRTMQYTCTYHDSGADCNGSPAVGVRYNIAVADRQECDGNEPHGIEQIRMLDIVVTAPTCK